MKTTVYIVASTNIESTKAFTNPLFAQDYRDELTEKGEAVTMKEQEIEVPYATDRTKYGMTLKEIRDEIAAFTGDKKGEAMRKAKIFAHHISISHVCRLRLSYGWRRQPNGTKTIDRDWLQIEWTDLDGDRDTWSLIE
jgi:hypothetical protein